MKWDPAAVVLPIRAPNPDNECNERTGACQLGRSPFTILS